MDMSSIPILSPVNGYIDQINIDNILIYIPSEANHSIVAPIGSYITSIHMQNGLFKYDAKHNKEYQVEPPKTGRLFIEFTSSNNVNSKALGIYVEVGKPKYITNRVKINVKMDQYVKEGGFIGEILIGSLARVYKINGNIKWNVSLGQKVSAGRSVIGYISKTQN